MSRNHPSLPNLLPSGSALRSLDGVPMMAAYLDTNERYLFINRFYQEKRGVAPADILGRTIEEMHGEFYALITEHVKAAIRGEESRFDVAWPFEQGSVRWLRGYFVPDIDAEGIVLGFFAYLEDIDEHRRAELVHERFKLACDQGMEGFALHDDAGNFVYVNPAQASMYGYDRTELIGESWRLFYGAEQIEYIESVVFPHMRERGDWRGELLGKRKDGTRLDVEIALTLLVDEDGYPSGLVCNCRDITERKLAEASLRQLQKIDALGQLTGGVAHDFNNLLAIIGGSLELLCHENTNLTADDKQRVQDALSAVDRGADLTDQLLTFARKQPINPKVIDIHKLVCGVRDLAARSIGERVSVEVTAAGDLWPCEVDPPQLENALLNLAINARDAMPDGGTIEFRLSNVAGDAVPDEADVGSSADEICIAVADSGTGMAPSVREQMFDPFFTTKAVGKGNGLGLSTVHGFVTQSGGRIEVVSEQGEGTCISIYLPRAGKAMATAVTQPSSGLPTGGAESLLVVEDERAVRSVLVELLTRLGYVAEAAETGQQAISRLAEKDFDLVISDVVLPGSIDGPGIADHIRKNQPSTRCLLMSGYTDAKLHPDDERMLLRKPIRLESLAKAVRGILDDTA